MSKNKLLPSIWRPQWLMQLYLLEPARTLTHLFADCHEQAQAQASGQHAGDKKIDAGYLGHDG